MKALTKEIRIIKKDDDYKNLKVTGGNDITYNFSDIKYLKSFF